jgi:hypothetical protein
MNSAIQFSTPSQNQSKHIQRKNQTANLKIRSVENKKRTKLNLLQPPSERESIRSIDLIIIVFHIV